MLNTHIKKKQTSLIAGIAIDTATDKVVVSFLKYPMRSSHRLASSFLCDKKLITSYQGDYETLRNDKHIAQLPLSLVGSWGRHTGMASKLHGVFRPDGYELAELIEQLPELAMTKRVALFSVGFIYNGHAVRAMLKLKGIEMRDVTYFMMKDNQVEDDPIEKLAITAANSFDFVNK